MAGRPPVWTPDKKAAVQATICTELAKGRSLRAICQDEGTPSAETVNNWLSEDSAFAEQYAHARARQADHYADEITEISDTELDANRARVRIDARKWVASKLKPGTYGDRLHLDGDMRVTLSDAQLDARLVNLLGKTGAALAFGGAGEAETSEEVLRPLPGDRAA